MKLMLAAGGGDWLLIIPLIIGLYCFGVWIFQQLWNWTMPQVFALRTITFWQAFRLLVMATILFGSGNWVRFNF